MRMYTAVKNSHVISTEAPSTMALTTGVMKLKLKISASVELSSMWRPLTQIINIGRMRSMAV